GALGSHQRCSKGFTIGSEPGTWKFCSMPCLHLPVLAESREPLGTWPANVITDVQMRSVCVWRQRCRHKHITAMAVGIIAHVHYPVNVALCRHAPLYCPNCWRKASILARTACRLAS